MKLWKANRIDGEWELPDEEIAKRFMASQFYKGKTEPIFSPLIGFISSKDGLNSTFDFDKRKGSIIAVSPIRDIVERLEG